MIYGNTTAFNVPQEHLPQRLLILIKFSAGGQPSTVMKEKFGNLIIKVYSRQTILLHKKYAKHFPFISYLSFITKRLYNNEQNQNNLSYNMAFMIM